MADSVNSQVQHITALDFDMTKALQQLQELQDRFNAITQEIASRNWSIKAVIYGDEELDNLKNQAASVANQINNLENEIKNFDNSVGKGFNNVNEQLKNISEGFKTAQNSSKNYKEGLDDVNGSTESLNNTTSTLISTIEGKLVSALEQAARAGYEAVKSTEDSMVEIGRVLDTTSSETETLRGSLFELGNEYGRSFEDVSDVALRFAQAGYDMNDTISNTKALLLGMNTAELEASSGTTELIGILSQWGMEASELTTVIDKLNYTADNNAVTTQDLADALLKASSMAKTAGMSFDDTVGVLTAMKVASGAAGKEVGNAFKSIIAYIQRPESLKLFDNMGIDVFKDKVTGELLPMMDILKSMTEKWNGNQEEMLDTLIKSGDAAQMMSEEWAIANGVLDEYNQYQEAAAAATDKVNDAESRAQAQAAAGVFRRNYYIALMENFANAAEISKELINAEGHSMQENARYMETLTAKTEQLVVALTELAVTAADAGLLDLAKQAIETATAIVKWTTETKTLIPILTMVGSLLVTIKSQKIATEISAIGGAFGNAFNALKGGASAITGIKTAATSATGAATGLSAAIGAVGLSISAISAVIGIINMITTAIHEARQEAIDAGTETKNQIDEINSLYQRFEELRGITERTTEQDNEYKKVQKEIRGLLQGRTDDLKGLTLGTEAYASALEGLVNEERKLRQSELDNATDAAKKEMGAGGLNLQRYKSLYEKISNSRNSKADYDIAQLLSANGYATAVNDNSFSFNFSNDTIKNFTKLKSAMELLNEEHSKLIESGKIEEAEAYSTSEAYKNVETAYEKCRVKVETYVQALVAQKENEYIIQNGLPKTYAEQVKMNDVIFIRTGLTDDYRDSVNELIPLYYTAADAERDFMEALSSSDVEQTIISMAKAGTLTDTIFSEVLKSNSDLSNKMREVGLTSADVVKFLNEAYKGYNKVADGAENAGDKIGLTDEELKKLASTISDAESNITDLNKYMETLAEGNGLTAKEVMELCETYGLLADQFTLTEKGYTIEASALEELRDKQIESAVTARLQQAGYTETVINNILKRIQAYSDEVESISSVADAQLALEKLKLQLSDAEANAHINSQYDYAKYQEQTADLRDLIGETESYASTLEYLDELQNGLYQNLGESYSNTGKKTSDAAKETDNAFKSLIESIERLGEMGVYNTQELIDKFEELRRTAGYTEDQIKTIEDKLHELYSSQIEENLKAIEQEKKDYVDSVKEKYDEDKEALKKLLDDEKDMFKEQQSDELDARKKYWSDEIDNLKDSINAQINASKKAYETKKKLIDKSYDNQADALESLRDMELNNIKASYDAQISALEKIKAARKAQRDEEDYQDERAELLEQISYWEQRTGTEAVENLESLKKQLADLDKEHQRDLEDKEIDGQIDSLEEQRDNETAAVKAQYDAQISALKLSKETELGIYESTYNAEQEMLKEKLEKDVKAMEEARDADLKALQKKQKEDLKLLEEEHEKKLKDLEDEKDAAIKAAEEKWKQIEQIFNDSNTAMVASAGMFASDIYDQFNMLFTQRFEMDLEQLRILMSQLNAEKSAMESMSGTRPTTSYSSSSYGSMSKNSYGNSSSKNNVVKANTGGKTTADGLVMLHKNELIINPPTTKKLEDLLEQLSIPKTKVIIDPQIMKRINKTSEFYHNPGKIYNTSNNSYSNSYNNSRPIIQNFNAPLQNIENIEDAADMEAATNELERTIMRKISTKL